MNIPDPWEVAEQERQAADNRRRAARAALRPERTAIQKYAKAYHNAANILGPKSKASKPRQERAQINLINAYLEVEKSTGLIGESDELYR